MKKMTFQRAMDQITDAIAALENAKAKLEAGDLEVYSEVDEAMANVNGLHYDLDEGWTIEPKKEG